MEEKRGAPTTVITLPKLYTTKEAALLLRVTPATVERERFRGRIGYTKIAGRVFHTEAQILEYLEQQTVSPCPVPDAPKKPGSIKSPAPMSGTSTTETSQLDASAASQLVSATVARLRSSLRNGSSKMTGRETPKPPTSGSQP